MDYPNQQIKGWAGDFNFSRDADTYPDADLRWLIPYPGTPQNNIVLAILSVGRTSFEV